MEQRIVCFDLETGGLDPKRHPIIQLAAIAVTEEFEVPETIEIKIQFDEKKASADALRKNHYHPGLWASVGKEPQEAAREFAAFLKRHATCPMLSAKGQPFNVAQLAAHNSAFDGPFLSTWYERLGIYLPAKRLVLCTMQLAMWQFLGVEQGPRSFKLQDLCEHFGIRFDAAKAHDALGDVTATVELFRAMAKRDAGESLAAERPPG